MEDNVWSDNTVLSLLTNEYVLISLYVDDKTDLPENEQYTSKTTNRKVKTIGNKWSDFETTSFKTNSQPFYVLLIMMAICCQRQKDMIQASMVISIFCKKESKVLRTKLQFVLKKLNPSVRFLILPPTI